MNTIINYIQLRGDLPINLNPFNEADYLILCELAYINFEEFTDFNNNQSYTIKDLYDLYKSKDIDISHKLFAPMYELLYLCSLSPRYQNIKIIYYINDIDNEMIKQFGCIGYLLDNDYMVICFKGTDDSIIGWHEDFQMLHNDCIPAQQCSADTLERLSQYRYKHSFTDYIMNKDIDKCIFKRIIKYFYYYKHRPIIVLGHSKGGNLAMYASMKADNNIQKRIKKIYNFDGPGFSKDIINSKDFNQIRDRIINYVPHYSIFGLLFNNTGMRLCVKSQSSNIRAHDAMSWCVSYNGFIYDELSLESQMCVKRFNELLDGLSIKEKELFIEELFQILDKLEIYSVKDITNVTFKRILTGIKEFSGIEAKNRKIILDLITILYEENQKVK